jgi:hypothetical protein
MNRREMERSSPRKPTITLFNPTSEKVVKGLALFATYNFLQRMFALDDF